MAEPIELIIGDVTGLLRRETRDNNPPSYHSEEIQDDGTIVDIDLTDEEYENALRESGERWLDDNAGDNEIGCEVEPNVNYHYGEDYFIGDVVEVEDDFGFSDKMRIKELIISHTKDEYKIYPTFKSVNVKEDT